MNNDLNIAQQDIQTQIDWIKSHLVADKVLMDLLKDPFISEINGYLSAGCVYQRIWNILTDREINYGIDDYDIVYFDTDLSKESEDQVTMKIRNAFPSLKIDCVNQARVHLWYEEEYGVKITPFRCIEDAIDIWPSTSGSVALYMRDDDLRIYMPRGFSDLLSLTVRPNKGLITKEIYESKCAKWKSKWPELNVVSW